MTGFQDLDEHLALEVSNNYWSDEGIVHALALAEDVTPDGWADLAASWRDRPPAWQFRCADLLADVAPAHSVEVLGEMIGSPTDRVATRAADSLRTILDARPEVVPSPAVLARAEALASRAQGLSLRSLDQLIGHLRSRR